MTKHLASITDPAKSVDLLRAMYGYQGSPVTTAALKLGPRLFVRPGELRKARWEDVDVDGAEWRFTASKTGTPHIVPLAAQAIEVIEELRPLTGRSAFLFPGAFPSAAAVIQKRSFTQSHLSG